MGSLQIVNTSPTNKVLEGPEESYPLAGQLGLKPYSAMI